MKHSRWFFTFAALAASAAALEIPYDYHIKLTPETTIFGCFSATKKPVLTIKSGATVRIDGGGAAEWGRDTAGEAEANDWLKKNNIAATTETCPAIKEIITVLKETPRMPGVPGGHFIVGPIYVEDAEPGDSLEIRILDVTPRLPYGAHGVRPGSSARVTPGRQPELSGGVHTVLPKTAKILAEVHSAISPRSFSRTYSSRPRSRACSYHTRFCAQDSIFVEENSDCE